jgi:glycosyltransferase involved in cell wall biosynthesis
MGGELVELPDIGYGTQLGRTGRWLVRRSLTSADAVTVGSRTLAEAVRAEHGERSIRLAPLGIDTELFRPDGERAALDGDPCLLQVGSLTPVKNQALLLEAFARIADEHRNAHLQLVGGGPLHEPLMARAATLGLVGRVHLLGEVPHDRLPPIYRRADLHVVSSRFESQGMAVLEAAACGTATVGTAVGILPELGRAGVARTANADHPQSLAAALDELIRDRGRALALGRSAAALVARDYSVGESARRFEELYSGASTPAVVP